MLPALLWRPTSPGIVKCDLACLTAVQYLAAPYAADNKTAGMMCGRRCTSDCSGRRSVDVIFYRRMNIGLALMAMARAIVVNAVRRRYDIDCSRSHLSMLDMICKRSCRRAGGVCASAREDARHGAGVIVNAYCWLASDHSRPPWWPPRAGVFSPDVSIAGGDFAIAVATQYIKCVPSMR